MRLRLQMPAAELRVGEEVLQIRDPGSRPLLSTGFWVYISQVSNSKEVHWLCGGMRAVSQDPSASPVRETPGRVLKKS